MNAAVATTTPISHGLNFGCHWGDTTGFAASTDCIVFANGASVFVGLVAITLKPEAC
jgi:hypothetical protein